MDGWYSQSYHIHTTLWSIVKLGQIQEREKKSNKKKTSNIQSVHFFDEVKNDDDPKQKKR